MVFTDTGERTEVPFGLGYVKFVKELPDQKRAPV